VPGQGGGLALGCLSRWWWETTRLVRFLGRAARLYGSTLFHVGIVDLIDGGLSRNCVFSQATTSLSRYSACLPITAYRGPVPLDAHSAGVLGGTL
jgi:hypothetical protein